MLIALSLIAFITISISLLNKFWQYRVCAICAGVSLTWILFLLTGLFGYQINWFIPAILMGGSVVGITYWLEKHLAPRQLNLFAKTLLILMGFYAAYEIIQQSWYPAIIAAVIFLIIIIYYLRFSSKQQSTKTIQDLEKKMDDCC
ncbi:MAG: hypothetical protein HYW51_03600 [Candidatus Doudnabacteria bacterium]|nr:hypothetical protein [Candidatus Doudnabacteria bacterium]